MLTLAQFNLPTLIAALLIGVATGWWMFRGRRRRGTGPDQRSEDSTPP